MANKPVTMDRIRLIMQSLSQGTSIMEISRKYGLSRNTIKKYRNLLRDDGVNMPPITDMDDEQLSEQLQSPVKEGDNYTRYGRLKARKEQYLRSLTQKHMTKQLLWEQYKEEEEGARRKKSSFGVAPFGRPAGSLRGGYPKAKRASKSAGSKQQE